MSLVEMQSCLARLYTDSGFQQLFFLDPTFSMKEYRLTHLEMEALTAINRPRLHRFALSLMAKSRESFEKDYPLLFSFAGPAIEQHFPGFYHSNTFQARDEDQLLVKFGSFMDLTFKADPQLPSFYSELARYERQLLITNLQAGFRRYPYDASKAGSSAEISLETRVTLAPGTTCEEYSHNIVELAQLVREDLPVSHPETGSFIFLVHSAPGKLRPQTLELNPATRKLIELCDHERTVSEIIEKLEQMLGKGDLKSVIVENLAGLAGLGVLNA